ncbi:MAG: prolipoprotein diacylglyceryl transferase [Chloroflexi bacterium]|nr:prolipoprotein diacylglyceryl transferase [Chloroflexota bacterium]
MIQIPFDPEIHLGPLALAWHGIFTAVGIFAGVWLPVRLLRGRVPEDAAYAVATWGVVGGIVGARLLHVMDCWELCGYAQDPLRIVQIWSGGIAVWGAAIGGVLGGLAVAIRRGDIPIGGTADAAAAGIGLGFGIGRIGDIINGEHHAIACQGAGICVEYTHPQTLGQSPLFVPPDWRASTGPVHLVVGYEMIWDLTGTAIALLLRRRLADRAPEGRIFWIWLLWYGLGRLLFGYLRIGDPTPYLGLRQDQLIALGALVLAAVVLPLLQLGVLARVSRRIRSVPLA